MPRPKHLPSGRHSVLPSTRIPRRDLESILDDVEENLPRKRSASGDAASRWKEQLTESKLRLESDASDTSDEESELSAGEKKDMDHVEGSKKKSKSKRPASKKQKKPSSTFGSTVARTSSAPRPPATQSAPKPAAKPQKAGILALSGHPVAIKKQQTAVSDSGAPKPPNKTRKPKETDSADTTKTNTKTTKKKKTSAEGAESFATNFKPRKGWNPISEEDRSEGIELLDASIGTALSQTPPTELAVTQKFFAELRREFVRELPSLLVPKSKKRKQGALSAKEKKDLDKEITTLTEELATVQAELEEEERLLAQDRERNARIAEQHKATQRSSQSQQQKVHKILRPTVNDELPLDQLLNPEPETTEPLFYDTEGDPEIEKLKSSILRHLIRIEQNGEHAVPYLEKMSRVREILDELLGDDVALMEARRMKPPT